MWEGNRLKLVAALLTLGVIGPGMYLLFRFLFDRLISLDDAGFGAALASRLLSSAFMAFSVFLAISSLIGGISTLFRSRETSLLLGLPIRTEAVAVFRTAESWFYAGWSTILIGIPVILAYASASGAGAAVSVPGLLLLCPFVLTSVAVGSMLLALLSRVGGMRGLRRGAAGAAILSILLVAAYFRCADTGSIVIPDSSAGDIRAVESFVAGLPATGHSPWPHSLLGSVLGRLGASDGGTYAFRAALILVSEALLLAAVALSLNAHGFRRRHAARSGAPGSRSSPRFLFRRGGLWRAMIEKDAVLFARDPVQWSQLALLAGLFLMYAGNLDRFPMAFGRGIWLGVAVFMNVSFTGFVMATLLVRFSFPSTSMEGPGLHALLQMPRARETLLSSKWVMSLMAVLPLLLGAGIASTLRMGAGGVFMVETVAAIVLMGVALSSINTSLGAIYPNFSDNSPASIASGQGGIVAAFASMGYVLALVTVLSFATRTYLAGGMQEGVLWESLARIALFVLPATLLLSAASMRGALGSLRRRDF
ncbi:MAG: hypothetical protein IT351_03250 [Candidatus Fermentibacter sp.]|nr:hypothetical protein [Candidatus Fermentibacter sp.]